MVFQILCWKKGVLISWRCSTVLHCLLVDIFNSDQYIIEVVVIVSEIVNVLAVGNCYVIVIYS